MYKQLCNWLSKVLLSFNRKGAVFLAITHPIRSLNDVRKLEAYYLHLGELRNHLLVVFSIQTALRISDLLRLTWDDVYNFENRCFRNSVTITEHKTQKSKTFALNKRVITALKHNLKTAKQGGFLFKSRKGGAIGRVQAYRIIRAAGIALKFNFRVSCHSLRKTFGYLAWKNGASPTVIMEIYNHTSFAVTRRYLGVMQEDVDEVYHRLASIF